MNELASRRPLKSRATAWASILSKGLLRLGARPNQVSVVSVVFATGVLAVLATGQASLGGWAWLIAAVGIQLRLLCNLMDGMLAIEGGLKTPTGDLYNEFPDRLADTAILVGLGMADGGAWTNALGWACACGSLMTACVRTQGASLTGTHDFRGPMAKPHRMALATVLCLLMAVTAFTQSTLPVLAWGLSLMLIGIAVTLIRRLQAIAKRLHLAAEGRS